MKIFVHHIELRKQRLQCIQKIFLEVRGFFYTITKSKVYRFMVMTFHHPSKHQDLRSCYCPVLVKMLGSET